MNKAAAFFIPFVSCLILIFCLSFLYSSLLMKVQEIAPILRTGYFLNFSFLTLISLLPATAAFSILFSVGIAKSENRMAGVLPQMVTIVLLASLAYAFIFEIILPGEQKKKNSIETLSSQYFKAINELPDAIRLKDYKKALRFAQILGSIDTKSPDIVKMINDVDLLKVEIETETPPKKMETTNTTESLANDYFMKAQKFELKSDWYSAHYYYSRSFSLDPSRLDSQRLAAVNETRIASLGLNAKESTERNFATKKIEGYEALMRGNYLQAYTIFTELTKTGPKDAEVERYKNESGEALKKAAFYSDEFQRLMNADRESSLLFFSTMESGSILCCAAKSVVLSGQDVFFEDLALLLVKGNQKTASAQTQLAKLHTSPSSGKTPEQNILYLSSVDRSNPRLVSNPVITGNFGQEFTNVLVVNFNAKEVRLASLSRKHSDELTVFETLDALENSKKLGLNSSLIELELLNKIIMPFAFACLLMLAVPVGWMFRSNYTTGLPFIMKLGIPLIAASMIPATSLWFKTNRVLTLIIKDLVAPDFLVVSLIVFYSILIALILLYTAGRRDSEIIH